VTSSSTYATFTVAEQNRGTVYHVVGKNNPAMPSVYNPETDANRFEFFMIDLDGKECRVIYNNVPPQDFERSEQIVVIGKMKEDAFYAKEILMKCPSKYNGNEEQQKELE
jgi:cytochrome c-type biogenesis protein CcmE